MGDRSRLRVAGLFRSQRVYRVHPAQQLRQVSSILARNTKLLMAAAKGTRPPNAGKGRKKGIPNKFTGELRDMILQALNGAGGVEYLKARAQDTPGPFLALVGKVLPLQVQGDPDAPLVPSEVRFIVSVIPGSGNKT